MRLLEIAEGTPPGALVFEDDIRVGKRVRPLMAVEETFRVLLFLSILRDGSVVAGPGKRGGRGVLSAKRRASAESLPTKLQSALGEMPIPDGFHLTFHSSGIISNHAGARSYRAPLMSSGPQQLCRIDFEHPIYLRAVSKRSKDIVLPGSFNLTYALQAQLTVVPEGAFAFFADVAEQVAFVFNARNADGAAAVRVQLSIFGTRQSWPSETTITWVSQNAERHGFQG